MSSLSSHLSSKRRLELQAGRDHSQTQLSLALSPVLTSGYYSESLSQSVSARRPSHQSRRSTPPPAPLAARDEGVVIQAGMSFVLGHKAVRSSSVSAICVGNTGHPGHPGRTSTTSSVRQHFRPLPAHTMAETTSSMLSRAIRDFLGRTDHVMNEWKHLGKDGGSQRSRSTTRSCVPHQSSTRRFSARSLSSSRYSSTDTPSSGAGNEFVVVGPFSRVPSFQSVQSTADTDFGSCQDLNDYDEVFIFYVSFASVPFVTGNYFFL